MRYVTLKERRPFIVSSQRQDMNLRTICFRNLFAAFINSCFCEHVFWESFLHGELAAARRSVRLSLSSGEDLKMASAVLVSRICGERGP